MFGSMERERERPGTKHNTIKGKIKQFLKGRITSKVIGGGGRGGAFDEKKDLYARKNCRRNEGNINAKKKNNNNVQVENSTPPPKLF